MKDLLDVLKRIVELLYQENEQEAYRLLIPCLPVMSEYIAKVENKEEQTLIMNVLAQVLDAMEEKDYTLMADILQYDLMEKMEKIGE